MYAKKQLKFVCKFRTDKAKNVTWSLNFKDVDPNYDAFEITHKYKANKKLLISTMEIVNPRVTYNGNFVYCFLDGKSQDFHYFMGYLAVAITD